MKIGIDAKWFFEGPVSAKRVLQDYFEKLLYLEETHEWHLFLDQKFKKEKFPHPGERIHLHYIWAGNNQLSNQLVLPRVANTLGLDLVFFQNYCPRWGNFKKVVFIHDLLFLSYPQFFTWKERLYFRPIAWSARWADQVITSSESEKKRIMHFTHLSAARIAAIPFGVSARYQPREAYQTSVLKAIQEKYKLPARFALYVGRINVRKNLENLLKSMPLWQDTELPLVIIGEKDWKAPALEESLSTYGLHSRVQFTGYVPDQDLPLIYSLAHVFCFPSLAEGFGLPPLEAMAAGVPVAVSEIPPLQEVCGEAGSYFDPLQPEAIAQAINQLLENQTYYQEKRKKGLARAQEFSWQKSAWSLLEVLELLGEKTNS